MRDNRSTPKKSSSTKPYASRPSRVSADREESIMNQMRAKAKSKKSKSVAKGRK